MKYQRLSITLLCHDYIDLSTKYWFVLTLWRHCLAANYFTATTARVPFGQNSNWMCLSSEYPHCLSGIQQEGCFAIKTSSVYWPWCALPTMKYNIIMPLKYAENWFFCIIFYLSYGTIRWTTGSNTRHLKLWDKSLWHPFTCCCFVKWSNILNYSKARQVNNCIWTFLAWEWGLSCRQNFILKENFAFSFKEPSSRLLNFLDFYF